MIHPQPRSQHLTTLLTSLLLLLLLLILILLPSSSLAAAPKKDKGPWYDKPQPRFAKSDLGPVFSGSINFQQSPHKPTLKALAIRVGESLKSGQSATIIYDTELLRASGAIPNRSVMFNTYRDGLGGSGHWVGPPYIFNTTHEPGWTHNNSFDDPRENHNGPLPHSHAQFHGFHRHGPRTVLSYSVNETKILESPWIETLNSITALTRTFQIQPSTTPLTLKVLDKTNGTLQSGSTNNRPWIVIQDKKNITAVGLLTPIPHQNSPTLSLHGQDRIVATLPSQTTPSLLKLLVWTGPASQLPHFHALLQHSPPPQPLQPYTLPGPPQWTNNITTRGQLGANTRTYAVDTLTPPYKNPYNALMTFGGHDFFANGDAAICTIHGDVWRVTGINHNLKQLTWHRYATGLFQPLGLKIVRNQVYVLGRDAITRLHDHNNDHQADYYENFNNDCKIGSNVHEYTTSLETDPDGNFYYNKGNNGGESEHDGSLIRVSKDGKKLDVYATGFRWPNGGGAGPDGTITVADQQGTWVPASRLDVIQQGGFYGYMPAHHRQEKPQSYDGPLCWIPHSIDNSCGGQTWVSGGQWGPLDGYMIHLSYGKCSAFLVLEQTVNETRQAGLVPLGVKFQSGAMRARFRPQDGQLYVSGLKGWQTSATKDGSFQRVRYTGKPLRIPTGLSVHKNGALVTFPITLDQTIAADPESWAVEQWNYRWTRAYGSKEYKVSNPEETGHDPLKIESVRVSDDGKSVFLTLPDIAPVMQMKIQYNLGIIDGKPLRGAIHNTIHQLAPEWETTNP